VMTLGRFGGLRDFHDFSAVFRRSAVARAERAVGFV
jgi:hypothetical protein